tara:strand:- start:10279 stop:10479 length:201 start_codon:yes stop_codon:yes gene_type:complete
MQIVKEIVRRYTIHTEEHGDVIPVSKLEEMLADFQSKPYEQKLTELDSAMKQLNEMIGNLGKEIDD